MGMGLSIARTIIEAHNGLISAKNRDHGGASFRIRLPFVPTTLDRQGPSTRFDAIRPPLMSGMQLLALTGHP